MSIVRNPHREKYTVVGRPLINDDRLSFRARGILVWLLDKPDGWQFDSTNMATIAREGRDAIRTALRELEVCGYLTRGKVQAEGGKWVTETMIYETPIAEDGFSGSGPTPGKPTPGFPTVGFPGAKENTETSTEIENTPLPPKGVSVQVATAWDLFWEQYPRKTGKPAALRAFMAALKRGGHQTHIIRGEDLWLAHWREARTDVQFIPHPATWLNQERYNDTPPPVMRSGPNAGFYATLDRLAGGQQ